VISRVSFLQSLIFRPAAGEPGSLGGRRHELNSLKRDVCGPVAGLGCRSAADDVAVIRSVEFHATFRLPSGGQHGLAVVIGALQALPLYFTLRIPDDLFPLYLTVTHGFQVIFSMAKNCAIVGIRAGGFGPAPALLVRGLLLALQLPARSCNLLPGGPIEPQQSYWNRSMKLRTK